MKRPRNIAAIAALSIVSALPFATTPASAAVALPKFLLNVERPRVNDDLIRKIRPEQTEADVTALIGVPQRTTKFPHSHTVAWSYDYRDNFGYEAVLSVIFSDAGVVQSKVTVRYNA